MKVPLKIIILILLLAAVQNVHAQWYQVNSNTTENLGYIHFADSLSGFCTTGTKGGILKTTDGGENWQVIYQDTFKVTGEIVSDASTVYCFGTDSSGNNIQLTSLDSGSSWILIPISFSPTSVRLHNTNLYFIDNNDSKLKKLVGDSIKNVADSVTLYDVKDGGILTFYNKGGNTFTLKKSNDFGLNWENLNFDPSTYVTPNSFSMGPSITFFNDTIILFATYPNVIGTSNNNGVNWSYFAQIPLMVITVSTNIIFGVDNFKRIQKSSDGGATWQIQDSTGLDINNFFFLNKNLGFACGTSGTILKTSNGGELGINEKTRKKKGVKVYPNPANENIRIEVAGEAKVKYIRLFDLNGKMIREFQPTERVLSIAGLVQGQYLLSIEIANKTFSEKIILQ